MKRMQTRLMLITSLIVIMSIGPGRLSSAMPNPMMESFRYRTTELVNSPAISPHVWTATENGASASLLVVLREQADVGLAHSLAAKAGKSRFVYETLRQTALRTQASLRAELDQAGVPYHSYYLVNMIELTGDRDLVLKLAERPDVARIEANPQISNLQYLHVQQAQALVQVERLKSEFGVPRALRETLAPKSVEWNIQQVNAPGVWSMGHTGQGVVVAGADTGYQWDHPALKSHYRGWNGITVTHDYNWHDAIHDAVGDACGNSSPVPCDPYGHGTHTMGTLVGDDGAGNQVGMAPGAQWIGCRNMDSRGYGTPARYIECFEFFLAPYPFGGDPIMQGIPSLAPAVIGNSWSCPDYEGCSALTLQAAVDNLRAAGIEVVAAAQNSGPSCSSVRDPIGIYASAFTVGATDSSDAIAGFSSRGPVTADGSNRRKPDISAPGVGVRSAYPTNAWADLSGTSMATPHVAGLFALLWSAAPGLMGNLAATEAVITATALHLTTTQGCGSDTPAAVPNNVYGGGRIDALAAVRAAQPALQIAATADSVLSTRLLTYTLTVANPSLYPDNTRVIITDTLPLSVTFASASAGGAYSDTVRGVVWSVLTLTAHSSLTFTLSVTVGDVTSGTLIVNHAYGARSDQMTQTVSGPPVTTVVGGWQYTYYLPMFWVSPCESPVCLQ